MEKEIWKYVIGYEGIYQISNTGKIKGVTRVSTIGNRRYWEKLLKEQLNRDGYSIISLCKNGKYKTFTLHRLVAIAFIPNPDNLPEVNHIDGNTRNWNLSNLEWCSKSENAKHAFRVLGRKKMYTPIAMVDDHGEIIKQYKSVKEASEDSNVGRTNISLCINGRTKTAAGYFWVKTAIENV